MQTGTVEVIDTPDIDVGETASPGDAPPLDMYCPVCQKKLRIHDPNTGMAMPLPPAGRSFKSRAKCTGCGTILYHRGDGIWCVLLDGDLTDEDRAMDKLGF